MFSEIDWSIPESSDEVPTPRSETNSPFDSTPRERVRPGTSLGRSIVSVTPSLSSFSPCTAVTTTGTLRIDS